MLDPKVVGKVLVPVVLNGYEVIAVAIPLIGSIFEAAKNPVY